MSGCLLVNKMIAREEPLFKKCCFCIPLRSCLQTWACVKVVVDLVLSGFLIYVLNVMHRQPRGTQSVFERFPLAYAFCLITSVLLVDCCFMAAFIIGVCMKSLRNLRVFLYYSFYMVTAGVALLVGWICFCSIIGVLMESGFVIGLLSFLLNTCLDVCIILTVHSEIIKLQNKQQYQFFKMQNKGENGEEATLQSGYIGEPQHDV